MQTLDSRTERRAAALPQFDLLAWDSFDPDRTIERLPALSSDGSVVRAQAEAPLARHPEPDMASTVELVPEVSASDIIESEPSHSGSPAVPADLCRLLARARAETRRSPDFFHPATLAPPALYLADEATPVPTTMAAEARALRTDAARRPRWASIAVGVAAAVFALGIAITQSGTAGPAHAVDVKTAAASAAVAAPTTSRISAERRAADAIPAVSVQSLPRVESGTISLAAVAAAHRLFIDGKLAADGSAVVTCGSHVVQVGSKGSRRRVDVPCGQEVVVAN